MKICNLLLPILLAAGGPLVGAAHASAGGAVINVKNFGAHMVRDQHEQSAN